MSREAYLFSRSADTRGNEIRIYDVGKNQYVSTAYDSFLNKTRIAWCDHRGKVKGKDWREPLIFTKGNLAKDDNGIKQLGYEITN